MLGAIRVLDDGKVAFLGGLLGVIREPVANVAWEGRGRGLGVWHLAPVLAVEGEDGEHLAVVELPWDTTGRLLTVPVIPFDTLHADDAVTNHTRRAVAIGIVVASDTRPITD